MPFIHLLIVSIDFRGWGGVGGYPYYENTFLVVLNAQISYFSKYDHETPLL